MRLFLAVDVPIEIPNLQIEKKHTVVNHAHVTLQFIGELEEKYLDELMGFLNRVKFKPFQLNIEGWGYFGSNFVNSVHYKVKPNYKLMKLQNDLFEQCVAFKDYMKEFYDINLTFPFCEFKPHITLLRIKEKVKPSELPDLSNLNIKRSFQIESFKLYDSKFSHYELVEEFF